MNFKKIALTASLTFGALLLGTQGAHAAEDAASNMVNPKDKVLVGYWHSWKSSGNDGYKRGSSADIALSKVPVGYNVVDVSFMKAHNSGSIPTFKPEGMTDAQFRAEVAKLNAEERTVILALGGADAHIELKKADEQAFINEIIRLVETYGFDGIDIDLEQAAIQAGDNQTVIPSALRKVKDHYRQEGKNFMITMAPEFPYLTANGSYAPYIKALEGYYDFINPQYYNQGGDGFWSSEINAWVSQANDAQKEEFLYGLTKRLVTGTEGFIKIPADKFVIGIPANNDAAATGYVNEPKAVQNALTRLKKENLGIKGLMTWSVNWDAGKDANGKSYNNEFVKTYEPIVFDGETVTPPPADTQAPSTPTALRAMNITAKSVDLTWAASTDNVGVKEYHIFRNGKKVGTTSHTSFKDENLSATTTYTYEVKAIDAAGNSSQASNPVTVKTLTEQVPTIPAPTKPAGLKTSEITQTTATITWNNVTNVSVKEYIIYRDDKQVATTTNTSFADKDLKADTSYSYQVIAKGTDGQLSEKSAKITVKTKAEEKPELPGKEPAWDKNKIYHKGDKVSFDNKVYEAKWWTKGDLPSSSNVWKQIGGEDAQWNKSKAYNGGERVIYNGQTYEAKWWTQGDNPETSSVWVKVTE